MTEFMKQGERGERSGEPYSEFVAVEDDDQNHEHDEAGPHLDGESEQPEHCVRGYD